LEGAGFARFGSIDTPKRATAQLFGRHDSNYRALAVAGEAEASLQAEGEVWAAYTRVFRTELAEQARLPRDLFGNPFRPVAFDPRGEPDVAPAVGHDEGPPAQQMANGHPSTSLTTFPCTSVSL
jgi:hypothetical protein